MPLVGQPGVGLSGIKLTCADGRKHSPWVLTAQVGLTSVGSNLIVNLHYGGTLFTGGVLERLLADQIEQGRERLLAVLQA